MAWRSVARTARRIWHYGDLIQHTSLLTLNYEYNEITCGPSSRSSAGNVPKYSCSLRPQRTVATLGRKIYIPGLRRVNDGHTNN